VADDTKAVLEDSMSLLVTAKWKQNQVIQPLMSAGLLPETQIVMTMLKCVAEIKVIDPEWRQWENNKPDEIKEDREELKVSTSIFSSGLELSCREMVPK
jgi:DNA-binding transcriptional regulator YiaG